MSKLEQLQTFVKVVEHGGITHAAEVIHLSAPAVTKQIQNLEEHLGVALFDRVGRNLKLTEIGERYYQEAVAALRSLQQLESFIKTGQKDVSGILKIRTIQHFAIKQMIPRLPEFLAKYPNLRIKLETIESMPNFWKDEIDILYGVSIPGQPDWVQKRIGSTYYILCASPTYLEKMGTPQTVEDLKHHRYLSHAGRIQNYLIELKSTNLITDPYMWFSNYEGLIEAALQGLGYIWAHEYVVTGLIREGKLTEILPHEVAPERPIYLYYQNGQYIDPKIRAFVDFFV